LRPHSGWNSARTPDGHSNRNIIYSVAIGEGSREGEDMATDVSFKGVFPILVTPFDEKEDVDLDSFVRVVRFMAEIGVDGVTILGVFPGPSEGAR